MSLAPIMTNCVCLYYIGNKRVAGVVTNLLIVRGKKVHILDICPRCGGSGRIAI